MNNLTNCTGDAIVPFDPLSLCNPDGSDSLIGLPCSSSIIGNIFLIAVYGFLLGKGAQWISEGSDLLLRVWGPGLVGGLLLPTLGALPDALVIAMSVIQSTDPNKLQDDLNVGMGTLVGSNVVLLTIPFSMALHYGNVPMKKKAGGLLTGSIKSSIGIGQLLMQGIGDTIRVSLSADPIEEIKAGYEILKSLSIRSRGVQIISCPSCARQAFPVIETVKILEKELAHIKKPITLSIIGCVVNGPGEAAQTEIGLTGGGQENNLLYLSGVPHEKVASGDIIKRIVQLVENKVAEKKFKS